MSSPRYFATPDDRDIGRIAEAPRDVGHPDRTAGTVVDVDHRPPLGGPFRLGQLAGLTNLSDRQLVFGEDRLERVGIGYPGGEVADDVGECVEVGEPVGDVGEARVVDEVGTSHGGGEEIERAAFGRVARHHERLTVGDRQHEIVAGTEAPDPLRIVVAFPQGVVQVLVDVEHRLGHRDVEPLTTARTLALVQGGDDRGGRLDGRVDVGVTVRILRQRPTPGVALRRDDAGLGFDHRRVRAPPHPRTGLPVSRDRRVDQPRG